jgi:hypothetical protein
LSSFGLSFDLFFVMSQSKTLRKKTTQRSEKRTTQRSEKRKGLADRRL